jgi:signal transduction histidine kinase/CheY-like chemotaxis protein
MPLEPPTSPELEREAQRLRLENMRLRQQLSAFEATEAKLGEVRQQNQQLLQQIQRAQTLLESRFDFSATDPNELQHAHSELERAQQELLESRQKAREDSEAKNAILATVSHELRTPINSLLGMVELILNDSLPSLQRERMVTIRSSAEELLLLLNDMLDYSRLESGHVKTERTFFRPQVLAEETATLMAPNAHRKGIEFFFHFHPSIPATLLGDPFRLRQVLVNLLDNAIKFTDAGYVLLEVTLERREQGRVWLGFSVKDTGIGLSKEAQEHVFEAFTQASESTARRFGGSGLGLTISHQIVQLLGGELSLESEEGKGACFSFQVPFDVEGETVSISPQKPLRIMLLQSMEQRLLPLEHQLKELGHTVVSVFTFQEALHFLLESLQQNSPFDVLFLEQQEQNKEWHPFWYAIRLHPQLRRVAILLMRKPDQKELEDISPDAQLLKPVLTSQLQEVLGRLQSWSSRYPMLPAPGPKMTTTPPPMSAQRPRTVSSSFPAPLLGKKFPIRVLVAEDNTINQKVAFGLLTRLGCEVETASDGQEALEMAAEHEYDLIFMDCRMPRMDGFAATQALREQLEHFIPIVAMTANVLEGDRERCLEAGMDDYVTKPMRPETLKAVLERWV